MNVIRLSNQSQKQVVISLEPEGTILNLFMNKSLEIHLAENGTQPQIDIQLHDNDGLYLSIWPEGSTYSIVVDGIKC